MRVRDRADLVTEGLGERRVVAVGGGAARAVCGTVTTRALAPCYPALRVNTSVGLTRLPSFAATRGRAEDRANVVEARVVADEVPTRIRR